jgi:hypothetical protein
MKTNHKLIHNSKLACLDASARYISLARANFQAIPINTILKPAIPKSSLVLKDIKDHWHDSLLSKHHKRPSSFQKQDLVKKKKRLKI